MARDTVWVDGKDVPFRPWEVELLNGSEPSLARCLRAVIACKGRITDTFTFGGGFSESWRSMVGLMVLVPDGYLAKFREIAKPYEVRPTKRIQVGMHDHRCGECDERCPPGHHGGTEWRGVDAEPRR